MQTLINKINSIKASIKKAEGNIKKSEQERIVKLDYIRLTEKQIHDKYDGIKKMYELKIQLETQKLASYEKRLQEKSDVVSATSETGSVE